MPCKVTLSIFELPVMNYFCLKRRDTGDAVGLKRWNKNFVKRLLDLVIVMLIELSFFDNYGIATHLRETFRLQKTDIKNWIDQKVCKIFLLI